MPKPASAPPAGAARPATIQDVARLAGVSVATVSAVVNGNVRVSEERTAKVRAAVAALHYQPDERGRMLRTGKTRTIGVVVPDVTNPFYPEIFRQFEHAARARGYSVLLCDSENRSKDERSHLEQLVARRVDGALVACVSSKSTYDWLADRGLPVVFFERIPLAGRFVAVSTNHRGAAREATRHFLGLGHKRIAFFLTDPTLSSNQARIEGFREEMAAAGIAAAKDPIAANLFSPEDAIRAGLPLLRKRNRPTAVLFSNSVLLLGLARAAADCGLAAPADLSLMCFDNPSWTEFYPPPITTMAQPIGDIAKTAVELLLQRMQPGAGAPGEEMIWLEDRLIVRGSTARAPRGV